ncbi:MAG TPA: FG-GAP-like repeat-containing protein, partial [Methylomirabilota bacterium]|nr:FG-GAP-like repeat-containing protein [Methylomirabilota bacterium]
MDRLAFMHVIPWVAWLARLAFPDASASPAPDATFWFLDGDLPRGQFGQALAGGDVNGDGFADVVVGARLYHRDSSETWHAGRALLFPGSPEGPAPSPAWFVDGTHREERFGEAVAHVGDVNGDGFGDVLIGAWNHEWKRGGLWLYYGSASGLRTNADWYVQGHVDYLCLGYAVAGAGDVNGDGFADIVVGAIFKWDFNRKPPLVYAYYGSPKGPRRHPDWSYTETNVTRLGWSVAGAGDVNGDGFDDILVGDSGSLRSSPRALVFHGGRHG